MQELAALDSNLYFGNYPRAIENNYFYLLLFLNSAGIEFLVEMDECRH